MDILKFKKSVNSVVFVVGETVTAAAIVINVPGETINVITSVRQIPLYLTQVGPPNKILSPG